MTAYVALLRAVNVGGALKLPMADLRSMCSDPGFARAETYIASGNVVFASKMPAASVKSALKSFFAKGRPATGRSGAERERR